MLLFKKIKLIQLSLGISCLAFVLLCLFNPKFPVNSLFQRIDGLIYDSLVYLTMNKPPQNVKVVVVDINENSIKEDGRWPWPRDKIANLITNLKKGGVVVVAFDTVFSEAEINYAQGLKDKLSRLSSIPEQEKTNLFPVLDHFSTQIDNDQTLAQVLKNSDTVFGYLFHDDLDVQEGALPKPLSNINPKDLNLQVFEGYNGILPLFLKANPSAGYVSNLMDEDGVLRHGILIAIYNNQIYASLTLATVMHYLMATEVNLIDSHKIFSSKELEVGGIHIPINDKGQILIPFFGMPETVESYSASDILHNRIPAEDLSGSIAIVGSSMILLSDLHQSPVAQNFPGVEMVANMISGVLSQQIRVEYKWDTYAGMLFVFILGLIYAFILPILGPVALIIFYLVSIISFLIIIFCVFLYGNLFLYSSILLFLISLQALINFSYNFLLERKQKNKINQLFGHYLPSSHIKKLLDSSEQITMDEDTRDMTVFFADIRNFTTISEPLEAKEIKRLLNTFFTPLTEIIFSHKGTIDKYVGDMVMAFWGAPTLVPEHAFHAVSAALEIKERLSEINQTLVNLKLPDLKIGMGLSSGMMDVGDMGSSFRRSYTVLGDPVNVASRLQDLTKFYQVPILVSEGTRKNQEQFFWLPVDKVTVKGRQSALMTYSPLCHIKDATAQMQEELKIYEEALSFYYQQDWPQAIRQFKLITEAYPKYYLYKLYLMRCKEYERNPPPANWDGTFYHVTKY